MHPIGPRIRISYSRHDNGGSGLPADHDTRSRWRELVTPAFAAIVRRHQSMVFSLALHMLRNRTAAEDLAQEVFLELYRSLSASSRRRTSCRGCAASRAIAASTSCGDFVPHWGCTWTTSPIAGSPSFAGVLPRRATAAAGLGLAATGTHRRRAALSGRARAIRDCRRVGDAGEHRKESPSAIDRDTAHRCWESERP